MSAPPQGIGGISGITPSTYVGTFTGSNPSNTTNGQWWYRIDLGQIWMNVNGNATPVQGTGGITVIMSDTTYANTDIFGTVLVTNNATLTIYGNVSFHGDLIIEGGTTLQSSNPNATSSATQTNNYYFYGRFFLNGTYSIAQYNTDNIQTPINIITTEMIANTTINPTLSGSGTLSIPSNITLTISANITVLISNISGSGTLSVSSGYTLTFNTNFTLTSSNVQFSGSGTLSIGSSYTLTISNNITWTLNLAGSGALSVGSGYTLTIDANSTWNISTISGSGTISITSGYTLTINNNVTWSLSTISGSGTLSVSSGYTLTQGASITISLPTINIAGTWANAGYGITIPSAVTVTVTVTGSLTTSSTAGTLTVDGTCYWFGTMSYSNSISGLPSFPLTFSGTGIFIGAPSGSGNGGNASSLSSVALSTGSSSTGPFTGSGIYPYYIISSLEGPAVGKYAIGIDDSTKNIGNIYILIYIGTANTSFNINSNLKFVSNSADISGDSMYAFNSSNSAGTITITGTLYV